MNWLKQTLFSIALVWLLRYFSVLEVQDHFLFVCKENEYNVIPLL